jgi:hypothetical protein
LQEATRLAKDGKAFRIWLMQPDAWKGNKKKKKTMKTQTLYNPFEL